MAAGPPDIVLYASDVTTIRGAWSRTSSTTGAAQQLMKSAEFGWSSPNTPFATPQHYFEATFSAEANTPYHVWLRLRAANNSRANDSVWVQFSDALNTGNAPIWRTGSSSGLAVNLEACSGCGVSGWGWSDGAWWTGNYSVVKFPSRGTRTIRVQTREDGVQVDQIVLSAGRYFTAGPGGATNDRTIVPKSSTVATVPSEVVLYAAGVTRRSGNWALESDATAAYGKRQRSTDYGWAQAGAPAAAPADFLEWTFTGVARTRYRVWLRLRASNNSYKNDSVWVQFSDAVNSAGAPTYRIGTRSGLAVNLEACSGCGVSGWGWQRRLWSVADTGDVYFPTSGPKTIRIQTREDGVAIDQVVLSPKRFVDSPPGPLRNDTTRVNLDGTTAVIGAASLTAPPGSLTFAASPDHTSLVLSYKLEIFKHGVSPSTGVPSGTLSLGKPPVVSGQIKVDIGPKVQSLSTGTYVATVSAVGSAGSSRSAPSAAFTR
jgi:hypothetical protein